MPTQRSRNLSEWVAAALLGRDVMISWGLGWAASEGDATEGARSVIQTLFKLTPMRFIQGAIFWDGENSRLLSKRHI